MEINRLHVDFDLQSKYDPKGDQINAIAELTEGLNSGEKYQTLLGATEKCRKTYPGSSS